MKEMSGFMIPFLLPFSCLRPCSLPRDPLRLAHELSKSVDAPTLERKGGFSRIVACGCGAFERYVVIVFQAMSVYELRRSCVAHTFAPGYVDLHYTRGELSGRDSRESFSFFLHGLGKRKRPSEASGLLPRRVGFRKAIKDRERR